MSVIFIIQKGHFRIAVFATTRSKICAIGRAQKFPPVGNKQAATKPIFAVSRNVMFFNLHRA